MSTPGLSYGPLGDRCAHLCVDMQKLFAEPSEWATPWITRVLPRIVRLVERKAEQTIFTRFIPAAKVGQGAGTWKRYYERWGIDDDGGRRSGDGGLAAAATCI